MVATQQGVNVIKINKKKYIAMLVAAGMSLAIGACDGASESDSENESVTAQTDENADAGDQTEADGDSAGETDAETETDNESENETETETDVETDATTWEETDEAVWFSLSAGFYTETIDVELKAADGGEIHYTTDGTIPDETSPVYEGAIRVYADSSDFPMATCIQAVVVYEDGTVSDPVGHNYFTNTGLDDRFTTLVFAVSGAPDELTEGPDGIFYGDNYSQRGAESEREIYLEVYESDGTRLIAQYAGVRIFGGASRESSIKSMKLFARKSYDSDYGSFNLSVFNSLDATGTIIDRYDKLVLRNAGNDFQFAYIRDELAQTLAGLAGFSDYEAVVPAVGYLNGEYYGFYWLHESYCDDYFKDKYGDADGEFVVIEGTEQYKNDSDDEVESAQGSSYQEFYESVIDLDLTDDANYALVESTIDVENYLDYYAFNIYISNKDWPQNNYKCYRYVAEEGESYGTGVYDGRWRYLLHDLDYSFGLYDQKETKANYDCLKQILKEGSERYSPLFTALMQRDDCREYFVEKMLEYMNGALSTSSILETFEEMSDERSTELAYYYDYLESLRNAGDDTIWSQSDHLQWYIDQIEDFAASRPEYMVKFLTSDLNVEIEQNDDGTYELVSMGAEEE